MPATALKPRMKNPAMLIPGAMEALIALGESAGNRGVPARTLLLAVTRASQINGCGVCIDMHAREMKEEGETDERIFGLPAWREMPYYSDAERAALALTEAATRMSDRANAVPDEIWNEAQRHYDERALAALIVAIAAINAWNRINATTRQIGGSVPPQRHARR